VISGSKQHDQVALGSAGDMAPIKELLPYTTERLGLAMVPGYPAQVQVKSGTETLVQVRNCQGNRTR